MDVELRHARIVMTINVKGSISKAAVELGLPQSSLTAQLRRIEKALGGRIFVRSASGVVPTVLGERLIPMLAELTQQADRVIVEAAAHASDVFRFGSAEWTPASLLDALRSSLPLAEVQTETFSPVAAVDAVRRGVLTVAMVPSMALAGSGDAAELPLDGAVIAREPVWLALPQGHPLSVGGSVDSSQLSALNWVCYAHDHWFHAIESRLFAKLLRADPAVLHYADGHHEAMSWVRDARAAALTTPTGATRDVSLVPLKGTESTEMLVVWRRGSVARATLRRLVETLRRYYAEYAQGIPRYWSWIRQHPEEFAELRGYLAPSLDGV
ncbi:LysR family transcriptional regulator (plasmid) [Streptomyces decoyicus]|uniref:LysR family transcriptional regulator n=1 Tax=Streptomyces decoyicus TaxID=249567 RepID=UPI002E348CEA|nr:LysR family transcriptional regulator [Streptomyces decoyicus]